MHWCLSLAFTFVALVAGGAEESYAPPAPCHAVEVARFQWQDAGRGRAIPAKVYFPKEAAGILPVIFFSHGLGGSCDYYEYLGRHWAGCGYVSVHLTHQGSDDSVWKHLPPVERGAALAKAAADLRNALNRPLDVQCAIDEMEHLNHRAGSPFRGRLNLQAMAVAGHSFGGFTALALAGQTYMLPLGASKRYQEPRIKAAVQMSAPAPSVRRDLDSAFASITIPVMHFTGTKDFLELLPQTTAADRRIPFDHMSRADTCLVIFQDGDHFVFSGRDGLPGAAQRMAQDAEFQRHILAGTTAFWEACLKGNAAAKAWLHEGGYAEQLGPLATFESKKAGEK